MRSRPGIGWVGRGVCIAGMSLACCCAPGDSAGNEVPAPDPGSDSAGIAGPVIQAETLADFLGDLARQFGSSADCPLRRTGFDTDLCELWAVQQMLTTTSASNGAVGGAFRIPYFWHWVEPNPRLSIIKLPERTPLGELPPPEGYGEYKSYGYVDRTPELYLSDLAAADPSYSHPAVGEFTTFGWCSEREMALCALLSAWGHGAKVHQSGIHVTTRVWLEGGERPMELVLDTTFDEARLRKARPSDFAAWSSDFGEGANVSFYNRVCHDEELQERLRGMRVPAAARLRMTKQAERHFNGR